MTHRYRCLFTLFLAFAASLDASPLLYSIGPDNSGVPRSFNSISVPGNLATFLFNLGDGSLGFNGGLAFRPTDGLFYAIANDGAGASSLVSFSGQGGPITPLFSLGSGYVGGLTLDENDGFFYAISLDNIGFSTLDKIDIGGNTASPLFGLGFGFDGGLTFNPGAGLFYAISADGNGVPRLVNSISLGGAVTSLFPLGDGSLGFNGGLDFSPGENLFYVISNDGLGASTLDSFSLAGPNTLTPRLAIGGGFNNVGLTGVEAAPDP